MAEMVVLDAGRFRSPAASGLSIGRDLLLSLAATALIATGAHVAVPLFFTPVPITLQTLAVLFLGLVMGPRWAFVTVALYLAEGAAGLPVFSPMGPGGMLQLLGPTGGYLLSYPFAAALAGWSFRRAVKRRNSRSIGADLLVGILSGLAASLLILAVGATWLGIEMREPARVVLAQAVVPFLAGDAIKVFLAASAAALASRIPRSRLQS